MQTTPKLDHKLVQDLLVNGNEKIIIEMESSIELLGVLVDTVNTTSKGCITVYGTQLINELIALPNQFEWMSRDIQLYLQKCVSFVTRKNLHVTEPFVLMEMILSGRVKLVESRGAIDEESSACCAVFCLKTDPYVSTGSMSSIDGSRMVLSATLDELVSFYSPSRGVITGTTVVEYDITSSQSAHGRSLREIVRILNIRYGKYQVVTESSTTCIDVPTVGIKATFDSKTLALTDIDVYLPDITDSTIAEFIHLVS
jgi:hypothetical protein